MTAATYRSRPIEPVEVRAIQWIGDNGVDVIAFAGTQFNVIDPEDRETCGDPDATAQLFDDKHWSWVLMFVGEWIVRLPDVGLVKMSDPVFRKQFPDRVGSEPGS